MQLKKFMIIFLIVGVVVSLGIIGSRYFNSSEKLSNDKTLISYYVETGEGTGVYEKQDGMTWPEGYVFNEEKSSCDNGSALSWDINNSSVIVNSKSNEICKIYFDKAYSFIFTSTGSKNTNSFFYNNEKIINKSLVISYKIGDIIKFKPVSEVIGELKIYDSSGNLLSTFSGGCDIIEYKLTGNEAKIDSIGSDSSFVPGICQ